MKYTGFGIEIEAPYFYVIEKDNIVEIYERYTHRDEIDYADVLKLQISKEKWDAVEKAITGQFNMQLRQMKKPIGKFNLKKGTPIDRMLGKEMMVLLWSIEHAKIEDIPKAILNWSGFQPEERWWLYMMTNAASGNLNCRKGWRIALQYILCDNPTSEWG